MQSSGTIRTDRRQRGSGFTLIELTIVLVVIGILAAIALPNYIKIKDKAKEAEAKAGVHNIQISLERFATDNEGTYPQYLIGGEHRWMETRLADDKHVTTVFHESSPTASSDPLLRGGYVSSYPSNPFVRNALPVQQLQAAYGDPMRSSYPDGRLEGTRFGASGKAMGQVLCDARWLTWTYSDPDNWGIKELNTWSNVQYDFYDVWLGNRAKPYLPGSFLYKSVGEIVPQGSDRHPRQQVMNLSGGGGVLPTRRKNADDATYPVSLSTYMLGAWGGVRTKGEDLLGEEPLVIFAARSSTRQNIPVVPPSFGGIGRLDPIPQLFTPASSDHAELMGIPPWTRGVNRSHVGPLWGSPYGPGRSPEEQLSCGNPNGMRDGIILWLSPGAD